MRARKKSKADVIVEAEASFAALNGELTAEELPSRVYALFTSGTRASKAITAQYLAERLEDRVRCGELGEDGLRYTLPKYLVEAIEYVTPNAEAGKLKAAGENANGQ